MGMMNRIATCHNQYQHPEDYKRVLCVCSGGILRSPTAAWVLSNAPFNFNTRAAGAVEDYALIWTDEVLMQWCDEIVCMEQTHKKILERAYDLKALKEFKGKEVPIYVLNIPDNFAYRAPKLIDLIVDRYCEVSGFVIEPEEPVGEIVPEHPDCICNSKEIREDLECPVHPRV